MGLKNLSIIQYQNISQIPDIQRLWLPVNAFTKQVDYFSRNHFRVLSFDEAMDFMERKTSITHERPISLTFDNGYMEFYKLAFPLLEENTFPCTVLISPLKVGRSVHIGNQSVPYLSWSNLRELVENNVTIGAYEDNKWNINQIDEYQVLSHIRDFKKQMEDKLGVTVRYFGVKEGLPNRRIRDQLISEGYRAFLTQCPTYRRPDPYSIGRIQVDDDDFNIFLTKISRTYLFFKDRRSWKYIRKYGLDKIAHWVSETFDSIRGVEKN